MIEHVIKRLFLAAPPGGDGRHFQILAQQETAESGKERGVSGRFRQARSQGIGDGDIARAHRLHQRGHTQHGIAAQFQRIAKLVILAADDDIHRKQAAERFQEDAIVAHREIAAFHQRVAEVARQERVFEIGLVIRTGRQQHDARIFAIGGHQALQGVAIGLEEVGEPPDMGRAENIGQHARGDQTVLERVAGAGGSLRAIGQHPPLAVG